MAGGANKRFMQDKQQFMSANLIDVLVNDKQLIEVSTGNVDQNKGLIMGTGRVANQGGATPVPTNIKAAGVYDFDLIKAADTAEVVINNRTTQMPVYQLKPWGTKVRDQRIVGGTTQYKKPKFAHPIQAFWLPWSANSSWSVQLGPQADYFFTATMDGCSLAISSGAAPIVTHSNYKSTQNPAKASEGLTGWRIQQQHTALGVDVDKSLMKGEYVASPKMKNRGINYLVTVVGFRDPTLNTWSFYWQRRKVSNSGVQGAPTRILMMDRLVPIV
jgi:hypothetical protein